MICKQCQCEYEKWIPERAIENGLCPDCNVEAWQQWEQEQADNIGEINKLIEAGHPEHCACRQVWGDGECECDLYERGYDPYAWMKLGERE